jgi:hypothetical protein
MFYLRVVKNENHWNPTSFSPEIAEADFVVRPDEGVSVFQAADDALARRIFTLFNMGGKDRPETVCYILVPDAAITANAGLVLTAGRCDIPHPLLHASHHDIYGLETAGARQQLVAAIQADVTTQRHRLSKTQFAPLVKAELEDPQWGADALALIAHKPKWLALNPEKTPPPAA